MVFGSPSSDFYNSFLLITKPMWFMDPVILTSEKELDAPAYVDRTLVPEPLRVHLKSLDEHRSAKETVTWCKGWDTSGTAKASLTILSQQHPERIRAGGSPYTLVWVRTLIGNARPAYLKLCYGTAAVIGGSALAAITCSCSYWLRDLERAGRLR
jgi:hypothetical protein